MLGSGLTSLTILLDEPTRGLHPREVAALIQSLRALRDEGNTVIVVEHDPVVIRAADHLIDVGPGAGQAGGLIVAQGSPEQVARADSLTGQWLRGERRAAVPRTRRTPPSWLIVRGARAHNLVGETIRLPLGVLVGVCGVSGSGKSTLMIDTIGRVLAPAKQTTSVAYEPVQPGRARRHRVRTRGCAALPAPSSWIRAARASTVPRPSWISTGPLRSLYADSEDARALGLGADALAASCSACGGRGVITLDMGFLPDVHVPCETCSGTGYLPEAWQIRVHGLSLPEVYGLTIDQAYELFAGARAGRPRAAQRARSSGWAIWCCASRATPCPAAKHSGSSWRRELIKKMTPGTLYILDEPSLGQHLEDVQRLMGVLNRIVDAEASVMVVEHHPHVLAACDWLVELGPGGGPEGGRVIASGTPEEVAAGSTPIAPYLRPCVSDPVGVDMTWAPLLLADPSPCLRWLVLTQLLDRAEDDPEVQELRDVARERSTGDGFDRGSGRGRSLAGRQPRRVLGRRSGPDDRASRWPGWGSWASGLTSRPYSEAPSTCSRSSGRTAPGRCGRDSLTARP